MTYAVPVEASVYQGGSFQEGLSKAERELLGGGQTDLFTYIVSLTNALVNIANILAVLAIVIAGFFLLLGFGDEGAKDRAKRIIIYTLVGLIIINLARAIVRLFMGLSRGTIDVTLPDIICSIVIAALGYVALIGTVAIIIAGFFLLLGFGSESAKDTAKRIILYTIAGILVISFAAVIVGFVSNISGGSGTGGAVQCNLGLIGFGGGAINVSNGINTFTSTILNLLDIAIGFLALFAVVAIIVAGIILIVGFGSESSRERAKNIILYTILGLLVIVFARVIVSFFLNLGSSINTNV